MDNQILSLYAKGMITREIAAAFKELYDADVSPALVSKVTDAVSEAGLSGGNGRGSTPGPGWLLCSLGQSISADKP